MNERFMAKAGTGMRDAFDAPKAIIINLGYAVFYRKTLSVVG